MIPKFRIFDKKKKRFLGDFTMEIDKFGIHVLDEFNYVVDEDDRVLMQSTGLHDKNGKEIFEGDILKSPYGFIGKVNIVEGAWYVQHKDFTNNHFLYVAQGKSEIIGNIHEHPELLNQPNE
ncbi:YopX family protein [Macrococcus sp. FSL W8-0367]